MIGSIRQVHAGRIPRVRRGVARQQAPSDLPIPAIPAHALFRIQVVEEETGRGVPLVELRTVNQVRYFTDSNGIVAFDEPGLFNRKVFFSITQPRLRSRQGRLRLSAARRSRSRRAGRPRSRSAGSTSRDGSTGSPARASIATAC